MKRHAGSLKINLIIPLRLLSSSTNADPARLKMRFVMQLISLRFSLVELVIPSAFNKEMSPSHKMNRALMFSRYGNGLF